MREEAIVSIELPALAHIKSGKVREIFEVPQTGDRPAGYLIVATDRISAFDVVMPNGIPDKGRVLTQISRFWFDMLQDVTEHHLVSADTKQIIELIPEIKDFASLIDGRAMYVKKAEPLVIECIVRGYLAGSGWKDYKKTGSVCGISLPDGLKESEKLPQVIFTPSTKAEEGHDENVDEQKAGKLVGEALLDEVKQKSITLYTRAAEYALSKGIIICDTKFEFGLIDDMVILIDEILTPDSSRFWPHDQYEPGRSQPSFDKQFVRDYLESLDWDKTPPGPVLPKDIVEKTREKYLLSYNLLTGKELLRV